MRTRVVSRDPSAVMGQEGGFYAASCDVLSVASACLVIERSWDSLHEAAIAMNIHELVPGSNRIWYALPGTPNSAPSGAIVCASDLLRTHAPLGDIASGDIDRVILAMQSCAWSPHGEGEAMVARKIGTGRSPSMQVGDAIQVGDVVSFVGRDGWEHVRVVQDGGWKRHEAFVSTLAGLGDEALKRAAVRQKYMFEVASLLSGEDAVHSANLRACAEEAASRGHDSQAFLGEVEDGLAQNYMADGLPKVDDDFLRESSIRFGMASREFVPDKRITSLMAAALKVRAGKSILLLVPELENLAEDLKYANHPTAAMLGRNVAKFANGLTVVRG